MYIRAEIVRKQQCKLQVFPREDMQLTIEWCQDHGIETHPKVKHIMTFYAFNTQYDAFNIGNGQLHCIIMINDTSEQSR